MCGRHPSLTRAINERLRDESLIKRYTNLRLLTYLLIDARASALSVLRAEAHPSFMFWRRHRWWPCCGRQLSRAALERQIRPESAVVQRLLSRSPASHKTRLLELLEAAVSIPARKYSL